MKYSSSGLDPGPSSVVQERPRHRPRVLVIEPDAEQRQALIDSLGGHGYDLRDASDLDGGLRITREYMPDLVLCSGTPEPQDAREFCRRIKTDPSMRGTHVTLICGAPPKDRVESLDAGADDILVRPFEDGELHAHVRAGLRIRKQLRDLVGDQHRAALVELAATLGHEINNPLTALFGHMELVLHYLERGDTHRMQHHLREAGQVASRIGEVAQRLIHMVEPRTKTYLDQVRMLDL